MEANSRELKTFTKHFDLIKAKLQNREPFAFARYSDGELFVLQNKKLVLDDNLIQVGDNRSWGPYRPQDFKHFDPEAHSFYRERLLEAYAHKQEGYYKGISCRCCVGDESFQEQLALHGGDDSHLTWANLFVNANYPRFVEEILPILQTYSAVMVCHKDANLDKFEFVEKDFRVGYNAMVNDYGLIENIGNWIRDNNVERRLFLFSASTFSNLAIHQLYREFPLNTYMDIGTCLTPFMDMPTDRSYLQEYWFNHPLKDLKKVCIW